MIKAFQFYINENLVNRVYPSKEKGKSLIQTATERAEYVKTQVIDDFSAKFVFEDVYESMREAVQALMEVKGFTPYSHEALVAFLLEYIRNIPRSDVSAFNRYRILRNDAMYKARNVSAISCREAMDFLKTFNPKLKNEFEKLM